MEKLIIDTKKKELKLSGFERIDSRATIKILGSSPARIVIVPDGTAMNELQANVEVKNGLISDPQAYNLVERYSEGAAEVPFLNLGYEYIQFVRP